ncbi:unnamed protein product, partial [Ectocarpus sp. 12 AP-2014]
LDSIQEIFNSSHLGSRREATADPRVGPYPVRCNATGCTHPSKLRFVQATARRQYSRGWEIIPTCRKCDTFCRSDSSIVESISSGDHHLVPRVTCEKKCNCWYCFVFTSTL